MTRIYGACEKEQRQLLSATESSRRTCCGYGKMGGVELMHSWRGPFVTKKKAFHDRKNSLGKIYPDNNLLGKNNFRRERSTPKQFAGKDLFRKFRR